MNWKTAIILLSLSLPQIAHAVNPSIWSESREEDFKEGKHENTSFDNRGNLTLSPDVRTVYEAPEPQVWSLAEDRQGNLYAGTGLGGIIYKINPQDSPSYPLKEGTNAKGEVSVFFDSPEVTIQALALDSNNNLYAATTNHGIVYKITPKGDASVFYDSEEPYIWSLIIDKRDNIYLGTGDKGLILRLTKDGNVTTLYDSPESHILSLAMDTAGNLYAGSGNNGIIYKITPEGKPYALYDTSEPEVRALTIDSKGFLFAGTAGGAASAGAQAQQGNPVNVNGRLYRISPEGEVKVLYSSASSQPPPAPVEPPAEATEEDNEEESDGASSSPPAPPPPQPQQPDETTTNFFCLSTDSTGNLYAGSGPSGFIYKVTPNDDIITLFDSPQAEILALHRSRKDEIVFSAANAGGVYKLSNAYAGKGAYTSAVHDTGFISRWGKVKWDGKVVRGSRITIQTRTGNTEEPGDLWSGWSSEYADSSGEEIQSPPARFVQYRANLFTNDTAWTPVLSSIDIIYQPPNLPPEISITATGESVQPQATAGQQTGQNPAVSAKDSKSNAARGKWSKKHGLNWSAHDPNGDALIFDIYYRTAEENKWRDLKKDFKKTSCAVDTEKFPDGIYLFKVVASDRPGNPVLMARSAEDVSEPVTFDNTPPRVRVDVKLDKKSNSVTVKGRIDDGITNLVNLNYCLDNEEWETLTSTDGILDSTSEEFEFNLTDLEEGEHTVTVKAQDEAGNTGLGKSTFTY